MMNSAIKNSVQIISAKDAVRPPARAEDTKMQVRIKISAAVTAAVLALPMMSAAQKFQEPTKEELQMTSDPKAPGAAAVFLNREESTDNRNHYASYYARIKVLTELGKEWSTVEVPYVPGYTATPIIEGRTIHSDGTVIPLTGKAEDMLIFKTTRNNVKRAVFNLPSVEVGSILEYKWTLPMTGGKEIGNIVEAEEGFYSSALANKVPEWDVQQLIFVHKEHFYYNPISDIEANVLGSQISYYIDGELAKSLMFTQRLPAGIKAIRSPKGDFSLEIQDVPAFQHEDDAPPETGLHYQVTFYYSPYISPDVYWDNESRRWAKQVDDFASQSEEIKNAASQITAGADTPEAKARKLYDAVQALDNTNFTRNKTESERNQLGLRKQLKKAEDVWREKGGSGNDLATLYLALARAAGLSADGMKVADRDRRIFDPNYLSLSQLDSVLVVLHIDGKDIYLDPGQKLCPFGQLHWTHLLVGGMVENNKSPQYTPQNVTKDAITAHTADLTIDAQGGITGTAKILMNGPAALHWRQRNLTTDPDEVKKEFKESLQQLLPQGVSGEVASLDKMDTSEGFVTVTAQLSGQLGNPAGKRLLLPGFFFSTGAGKQFVSEEKREAAVDLHYADQAIDSVVYHLPTGFTVESAPQPTQLPWPNHAQLVVKTTPGTNSIEIKHIYARAFVLLDPKEYPALRDYYQKLAANDQQQLVLIAN